MSITGYGQNSRNAFASSAYSLGRYAGRYAYNNRQALARQAGRLARRGYNIISRPSSRARARSSSNASSNTSRPAPVSTAGGAGGYYVNPPARVRRRVNRGWYGKKLKKIGSKRRKGRYKKVMRALMHHITTPQTIKSNLAFNGAGIQGQRAFLGVALGGLNCLLNLSTKYKPAHYLYNTAGGSSTATLQEYGKGNWNMHIDKHVWDMRIQNRSNASMELKIYECVVRRDLLSSQVDIGKTGWASLFQPDTDPSFAPVGLNSVGPSQDPLSAAGTGPGTSHNVDHMWKHPSFTPYNSPQFCSFFKIKNTYTIKLGPNEITSKSFYQKSRSFPGRLLTVGMQPEWIHGWSKLILFSWVGMPVDDGSLAEQSKAYTDVFVQANVISKVSFTPGLEPLNNFQFGNIYNSIATTYEFDNTGLTAQLPVDQTVQTTAGVQVGTSAPV